MVYETKIWIREGHEDTVEEKAEGLARKDDSFVFEMEPTGDDDYPWAIIVQSDSEKQAFRRGTILVNNYWVGLVKEEYEVRQVF